MAESDETAALRGEIADAEAAMRKGKGGMLVAMGVLAVALIAGLVLLMSGGDEKRVYGEIGKKINGLKQAHFDQFWGCALEGTNLKDVRSNSDLASQINVRASEKGRRYAVHVRGKCLEKLVEIAPQLDTLIVPDDLKADVAILRESVGALRSAWSGLIAYLDNPELEYQFEDADSHLKAIAHAWFDFKKAHAAVNKTLKSKLE